METAMTGDIDTDSSNTDKQSVDLWNEVENCKGYDFYISKFTDVEKQDEKQPAYYDES